MTAARRRLPVAVVVACTAVFGASALRAQSGEREAVLFSLNAYDITYVISGGGYNAMALMRDDGVVLIDPLPFGWGKATLAAIETVSDQPVKTIVNIRSGDEFLRANTEFPTATRIVAHKGVADRATQAGLFQGAAAARAPNEFVTGRTTLLDGPDTIHLVPPGVGATSADLIAVFPEKKLAYLGEIFPSKGAPVVDRARGGSLVGLLQTLSKVRAEVAGIGRVVTGREPPRNVGIAAHKPQSVMPTTMTPAWKEFEEYVEFVHELVRQMRDAHGAGKTPEVATQGLTVPERFKGYSLERASQAVAALYAELGAR